MTDTDLQAILSDLAAAQGALRHSSTAFDAAMRGQLAVNDGLAAAVAGLRETMTAIADANHAQGAAIDAAIAATDKALRLFTATERH
jgi:hypothetical protein